MRELFGNDSELLGIDTPQIAEWRDNRLKTVSASTVVREANLLRNLFNLARREWKWVDHAPFDGVKLPKENAPRHQVWTWQLIKRVLRAPRVGKTAEMQLAFHIALRSGMRLAEVLAAPGAYDAQRRVVTLRTKTEARAQIPIGRIAGKLIARAKFTVGANEGSTLFSKLCRELLIDGLTFHDTRGTALTHLSKKVDVLTLAKISRHKDLSLLSNVYYRATADSIAKLI
jgi:integrase